MGRSGKTKREKRWGFFSAVAAFMLLGISTAGFSADPERPVKVPPLGIKPGAVQPVVAKLNLEQAQKVMITQIYQGKIGNRGLFAHPVLKPAGARIGTWADPNKVVISKDSWFFFVDEQPGANWEHQASYIVVEQETGRAQRIPVMTPPEEVLAMKALNPKAENELKKMRLNVQSVLPKLQIRPIQIPKKEKYAVLLSGGWNNSSNYGRYWNDLKFIHKALKEKYGYTDAEIIVLYANGSHSPNGDFDGDGNEDIDYAATKANLTAVFNTIGANLASKGKFFFYATNHGGDDAGDHKSNLTLWGEHIKDHEFADLTKKIKGAEAIYVFEQCFSGGMMDDILNAQPKPCTAPKVCVMTAARHDEPSWGCDTEGAYDEYVYHWTSAVYGKTPTGTLVHADANGDGAVTMAEAHHYAKNKDSRNEHPQIGSCVTEACNTTLAVTGGAKEDCLQFSPANATVANKNGRWKIVDGNHWMFDFGTNKIEAVQALQIIKYYKLNQTCFVGRPDPSFSYLLVNGKAPQGAMAGEDCIAFNPNTIEVKMVQGRWKIVDGSHWVFDFGGNRSEAEESFQIIKKYGFSKSCYVGRPDPSFTYLRK